MSKMEDFENAPVGATATNGVGSRAMKMSDIERRWILPTGVHYNDVEMVGRGYTLDSPVPTTAREALDLAWELAHEVEEGQIIPAGMDYLVLRNGGRPATMRSGLNQRALKSDERNLRTLDPLPETLPDWVKAPAVLARPKNDDRHASLALFEQIGRGTLEDKHGNRVSWRELRDVTPLYPKGQDA